MTANATDYIQLSANIKKELSKVTLLSQTIGMLVAGSPLNLKTGLFLMMNDANRALEDIRGPVNNGDAVINAAASLTATLLLNEYFGLSRSGRAVQDAKETVASEGRQDPAFASAVLHDLKLMGPTGEELESRVETALKKDDPELAAKLIKPVATKQ